jgi:general secretion pathway protein A
VELLAAICDELRIAYPPGTTSRKVYVDALHHHLLDAHGRGHRTVLIIDEAQDLAPDVLEQIRLLTNLETPTQKLLQIILIGQPELIRILEREDLRQLAQRVTARYHLRPFAEADTRAYVVHRLEVAGAKDKVFSDSATRAVHQASRGIPRLINAICDRSLLGAFSQDERRVSAATVRRAAREVLGAPPPTARRPWRWVGAAIAFTAIAAGGAVLLGHAWVGSGSSGRLASLMGTAADAPRPSATSSADDPSERAGPVSALVPEPRLTAARAAALAPSASSDATAPTAPAVPLGELLDDPRARADRRSAFASLYARWRLDFEGGKSALGCERGRAEGLECLFKSGTWAKLRRYNLPAIIELTSTKGDRRYATVVALGDETVTLDFGGRRYAYPLAEVDRHWEGAFIVLWKAPSAGATAIVPGARGKDVEWVRQRLHEADGTPMPARQRDVYDDDLRARVIAFQRSRSLLADGIVGEETLLHLSAAPRDPRIPRLSQGGS